MAEPHTPAAAWCTQHVHPGADGAGMVLGIQEIEGAPADHLLSRPPEQLARRIVGIEIDGGLAFSDDGEAWPKWLHCLERAEESLTALQLKQSDEDAVAVTHIDVAK